MWSLFPRKVQLTIVLTVGLIVAWSIDSAYAVATGQHAWIVKWASLDAFILGVALTWLAAATWRPLWRAVPALGRWVFPDLNGKWEGRLLSTWIDPETGQGIPPARSTIRIRQGLFNTTVSLKTGESTSASTRAFLEPFRERGSFRIWYTYNNDPDAQKRRRSSPHEGVAFLEMETINPGQLTGRYYTERPTTGDMRFTKVSDDPDAP